MERLAPAQQKLWWPSPSHIPIPILLWERRFWQLFTCCTWAEWHLLSHLPLLTCSQRFPRAKFMSKPVRLLKGGGTQCYSAVFICYGEGSGSNKVVEQSSRMEMTFQRSENANRNLTKASYRVEERRSAFSVVIMLSTHIRIVAIFYMPAYSLPISKEMKKVYWFLLHVYLSNSLSPTYYIFFSTSYKRGDTRRQK